MREQHRVSAIDHALAGIQVHRDFAASDLIVTVVRDWTTGQNHGALGLVHDAVLARRPSRALTQAHVAVGDHVLHLFESFVERVHAQLVAGKC